MLKIESDVPMPTRPGRTRYPFAEMRPGDSVFIECRDNEIAIAKAQRAARAAAKYAKVHIVTRTERGGLRVWLAGKRTAKLAVAQSK